MKKLTIIFLVFTIVTSCKVNGVPRKSRTQTLMESWVGSTESAIVSSWGPPTSTYSVGDGTRILTWTTSYTEGGNTWYDTYGRQQYNSPTTYTCQKQFYLDSSGVIYSWRYSGNC